MAYKYNIRKATGRLNKPETEIAVQYSDDRKPAAASTDTKYSEQSPINENNEKLMRLFETIVTHDYLTKLSECPIVAPIPEQLSGMGWWRITKIVLDKEAFFPDQLSMLYTALHNVAANVALVIDKKGMDDIEVYLGARDFSGNNFNASALLNNSIQGYLPGVKTEYGQIPIQVDVSCPLFKGG